MTRSRILLLLGVVIAVIAIFILSEYLFILHHGGHVAAPSIPRGEQQYGSGPELRYLVMGDSTSIGQGTTYEHSYAVASAEHLAQHYRVKLLNIGISGATAKTVLSQQVDKAVAYKPDIVLLAVGANDVTHFTNSNSLQQSLDATFQKLRAANPQMHIVVTGSPAMGSVPRFPWPADRLASLRTNQINSAYQPLITKYNLTFAPVAAKTGAAFAADPTLFAIDEFHPDTRGYALWIPVINDALDRALR